MPSPLEGQPLQITSPQETIELLRAGRADEVLLGPQEAGGVMLVTLTLYGGHYLEFVADTVEA
jgi:hypothetical protein